MATKTRNLFKKLARGGYSARIRFSDENFGERFFDAEWDIRQYGEAGKFTIGFLVNYSGGICYDRPSGQSIGKCLRAGQTIAIEPAKWNMRGRASCGLFCIRLTSVAVNADGMTEVTYETI